MRKLFYRLPAFGPGLRSGLVLGSLLGTMVLAAQLGCSVPEYPICLDCRDAGADAMPDAMVIADAPPRHDACTEGEEICDGYDDDCDGIADEFATGIGDTCSTNVGECQEGTNECVDGELVCANGGVLPEAEVCDGLDNDCDGTPDNGNPGGGASCSNSVGECRPGITACVAGELECGSGAVLPTPEECNGKDDDCDTMVDEDVMTGGSCGTTDVGECVLGAFQCIDGSERCVGAVQPTLELCDALDHDCDGDPLNTFNLQNDTRNCGTCGNVCSTTNAITQCVTGNCAIAVCTNGYWDVDGNYNNGCEYGPCTKTGENETCNQIDDDCDGIVDENLVPPDICDQDGACAGTVATCGTSGWECVYGADVQTDANGVIIPETLCDELDNDCDGATDESHPRKNVPCNDGGVGACQGTGAYICNVNDPVGETVCYTNPPGTPTPEVCNNIDDDCNGNVDEGALTGAIQDWVNVGGGVEMFAYEATRPDANQTDSGVISDYVCSRPGGVPWTNVTRGEAEAICGTIGARLCTELEWQRGCKGVAPGASPATQGAGPDYEVFLEAEDYVANTTPGGSPHHWVVDTSVGYSGASGLRAMPNDGTQNSSNYHLTSPRLDYTVDFVQAGTYRLWIKGWASNSSDESVHAGIDGTYPATAQDIVGFTDSWTWSNDLNAGGNAEIVVPSPGIHTINIWMREDGFRIDAILLTMNTSGAFTPNQSSPTGCEWSYGTNCNTYSAATCNGLDYDYDPGSTGNQDGMNYSGELAACYTDWGGGGKLFDMSGNVKEWTAERLPGVNPLRGGSYTSGADGLSCDYNFTVADDVFFFPNVGFRCCR